MGYSAKARNEFNRRKKGKDGSGGAVNKRDDGYEFVLPSETDDAMTFFVSLPKKQNEKPKGRAAPTEPVSDDD